MLELLRATLDALQLRVLLRLIIIVQTDDRIWLVSFMDYGLGYFDDETCRLEPLANPFGPKVLPMSSQRNVTHVSGTDL